MVDVENRAIVLRLSLNLEVLASKVLSYLLDVDDFEESYSLGNKSSSLSFNQKINLLIDNRSITNEEKKKLMAFASIRNQFMHNINANTFVEAFDHLDGLENQMKKLYPDNFSPDIKTEESLHYCVSDLHKDGVLILTSYKGGLDEKMRTDAEAKIYKNYYKKLGKSVGKSLDKFSEALKASDSETVYKSNLIEIIKLIKMNILSEPHTDSDMIDEIVDLLND
jgi:hypothetical protein